MEKKILESLLKRPGLQDQKSVLTDMIQDSINDMRTMLNYDDEEELPDGCIPTIKELVLVRYNQDGVEGISSESQSSGGSTTYMDALPDRVKRTVRKYRRLPG
ncbi:MAG TPA: phage head-tail connector protein [Candidatus Mediterraneibacter intestinipullorum]|nr:phage head-tail connector protein [Candidatus Mediterraneibacter intestinipullorum]